MSAGMTELTARGDIAHRRHGQRLGDAAVAACRDFVEAARAVDDAVVARSAAQCRMDLTADEDARLETTEADAWEALFIAALRCASMTNYRITAHPLRGGSQSPRASTLGSRANGICGDVKARTVRPIPPISRTDAVVLRRCSLRRAG